MPKVEHIEHNVAAAKAFKPLTLPERNKMSGELAEKNKIALDTYFRHHLDA
jgi:hypothetical protein